MTGDVRMSLHQFESQLAPHGDRMTGHVRMSFHSVAGVLRRQQLLLIFAVLLLATASWSILPRWSMDPMHDSLMKGLGPIMFFVVWLIMNSRQDGPGRYSNDRDIRPSHLSERREQQMPFLSTRPFVSTHLVVWLLFGIVVYRGA